MLALQTLFGIPFLNKAFLTTGFGLHQGALFWGAKLSIAIA
jgi:hypothetical protein